MDRTHSIRSHGAWRKPDEAWIVGVALGAALVACGSSKSQRDLAGGGAGTSTGGGLSGAAGASAGAGAIGGGTAGSSDTGGRAGAGGNEAAGGNAGTGGAGAAGTGGVGAAASAGARGAGKGGMAGGTAGEAPGGGAGAGASGDGGAASCQKGTTLGSEVAVIGDAFIALAHGITKEIEAQAEAAGSLGPNEEYVDNSVSGTTLANNQIGSQYTKAVMSSGSIKYVVMNGGATDCMLDGTGDAAFTAAQSLFQTMAQDNAQKVLYFFNPDPLGSYYDYLKICLDALRPKMQALCEGLTAPKCYFLDLRPLWNGHNEYYRDGVLPNDVGSKATGDAVWQAMVEACIAQ